MTEPLDSPVQALALVQQDVAADWLCDQLSLDGDDVFRARFQATDSEDWIEVTVLAVDAPDPVFRRLGRCSVRYRGRVSVLTDERRAQVGVLVLGVASAVDGRLAALPGGTIAEALGRTRSSEPIVFSRKSLRALLAPTVVDGIEFAGGWMLLDVFPASHVRERVGATLELVLDFQQLGTGFRLMITIARRVSDARGYTATDHFVLSSRAPGGVDPPGASLVRALVAFALQLRDHPALDVEFPDVLSDLDLAQLPAPEPSTAAENTAALNLAIDTPCNQSCAFCSIQDTHPPEDLGEAGLARYYTDLSDGERRGIRRLRLNGFDPLTYSRILDVLRFATRRGYVHVDVFSPCVRLADRSFCESVLAALPTASVFHVPLYGTNAQTHDGIVGQPGAHARVMLAIDNLASLGAAKSVRILSVATAGNLNALPQLHEFARERGFEFSAHMPYPSFESRADRYYSSVPRQADVVLAFSRLYDGHDRPQEFPVQGVAPCVTLRVMRSQDVAPHRWFETSAHHALLPGTEYRSDEFEHGAGERARAAFAAPAVPCPHTSKCVFGSQCGELLRAYVEQYGMQEFRAVSVAELVHSANALRPVDK